MVYVPKGEEEIVSDFKISKNLEETMEYTLNRNVFTYSLLQQSQKDELRRAWLTGFSVGKKEGEENPNLLTSWMSKGK